ncbi:hypothetical protein J4711_14165 [Staphylococcus epidermidis]|nr:hypothetical protein [Staphylococcus epidermidis]
MGLDTPITSLLEQLYAEGVKDGLGDLDQAGLFIGIATQERAGLKKPSGFPASASELAHNCDLACSAGFVWGS